MPYSLVSAIAEPFESVTSATDVSTRDRPAADEVSLARCLRLCPPPFGIGNSRPVGGSVVL